MRAMAFGAAVAMATYLAVACGGSSGSFPEEAECTPGAPLPTSDASPASVSIGAYFRRLQNSTANLERLRATLRGSYPQDTFYRRDEFRPDFAEYADQTVCTAQAMMDVSPPDGRFAEYDSKLDSALADLIDHTRFGREAVRKRNVSEYREWFRDADQAIAEVRRAVNDRP